MSGGATFRVTAVVSALLGALLILGTWDGLYSRLDLPQALPALGPQIGGVALLALAFLLWSAGSNLALRRPVAIAGALFYLGSAGVIAAWLIFKRQGRPGDWRPRLGDADRRRRGARGARRGAGAGRSLVTPAPAGFGGRPSCARRALPSMSDH